jgi:hypothetical protein
MVQETDYSVTYKAIANRLKEIRKAKDIITTSTLLLN